MSRFQEMLLSLISGVAPLAIRLLIRTWSFRVVNRRPYEEWVRNGGGVVGTVWHQMVIPGVAFFRDRRITLMISRSRDGEMIARVAHRLGFLTVRGSSTRGGTEALHDLIGALRRGGKTAITVDGPRGPARDPKIGAILAARATGVPLLPIASHACPAIKAGSWDRTVIPLPFARIALAFEEPFRVPTEATEEECEAYRLRLRDAINRAEEAAVRAL